jgi:hypothetical protein
VLVPQVQAISARELTIAGTSPAVQRLSEDYLNLLLIFMLIFQGSSHGLASIVLLGFVSYSRCPTARLLQSLTL